ncbi:MAG: S8 family serine peptidase, partial [Bryobacteraceae bacterium]|nr:S8 family serine peptidase [Bryobacteraceae bacterium]
MKPGTRATYLAGAVLLIFAAGADAKRIDKIAPDLKAGDEAQDYIVRYKDNRNVDAVNKFEKRKGQLRQELKLIQSEVQNLSGAAVSELSDDPDVEYISPNRMVGASAVADPAVVDYFYETSTAKIARSYGFTGKNIGVAIIDSGVFDHNDLKGTDNGNSIIVYRENFVKGESDTKDMFGHGTHVAGVLAGNGKLSSGGSQYRYTFRGVAPNVRIVSLRVLNKDGVGTDAAVISAIDRAIQLKSKYNIRVINLSVGRRV